MPNCGDQNVSASGDVTSPTSASASKTPLGLGELSTE
jgi:hypothetical protein